MTEQELTQVAATAALQQMVDFLLQAHARNVGMTDLEAATLCETMTAKWKTSGIAGIEASVSDHLSDEVAEAISGYWQRARDGIRRS